MITLTEHDLKRFAPRAKQEYIKALLAGEAQLESAGILETPLRLCHFLGQVGHETGGFTIIRESLSYSKPQRLREVWPARFRAKTDEELLPLCKAPVTLGDAVYGGRMGNKDPGDGYTYRGGGFLQTTGRDAVARYCKAIGVEPLPSTLDDIPTTLAFACHEWAEAKCNCWADENDIRAVSKAINTGSATSNVTPVGLDGRKEWFAKAWAIWGEGEAADMPAAPGASLKQVATVGLGGAVAVQQGIEAAKPLIPPVPPVVTDNLTNLGAIKDAGTTAVGIGREAWGLAAAFPILAGVVVLLVLAFFFFKRSDHAKTL